jgi:hypothetical protein
MGKRKKKSQKKKSERVQLLPPPEIIVAETGWSHFLQHPTDLSERTRRTLQAADRQRRRQNTARATERRLEKAQTTKVALIVGEALDKFRTQQPDKFRELRSDGGGAHALASLLHEEINEGIKNKLHRKRIDPPMLAEYIKKDRFFQI